MRRGSMNARGRAREAYLRPVLPAVRYALLPEAGVTTAPGGELPGEALIGLLAALEHGSIPALQQACHACVAALKLPLRGLIQQHLGSTPLRTRQVMTGLQSL